MPSSRVVYSIVHVLAGRVGFCVPRISCDPKYEQRLQALLALEDWVISQQVNTTAGSIVITYKTGVMPDPEIRSHLVSLIQSASVTEVTTKQPTTTPVSSLTDTKLYSDNKEDRESLSSPVIERQKTDQLPKQPAKVAYSIAHAIPGRVRFRVPKIASDPKYVQRLEALLKVDPAVTSERVNSTAASIVITYKTEVMLNSNKQTQSVPDAAVSHYSTLIQFALVVSG